MLIARLFFAGVGMCAVIFALFSRLCGTAFSVAFCLNGWSRLGLRAELDTTRSIRNLRGNLRRLWNDYMPPGAQTRMCQNLISCYK